MKKAIIIILTALLSLDSVSAAPKNKGTVFTYLGNEIQITLPKLNSFSAVTATDDEIDEAWAILGSKKNADLVASVQRYKEKLRLCDWATYKMVKHMADSYYSDLYANESVLTQAYILSGLGYKVQLARVESQLYLMMNFDGKVYHSVYFTINGEKYYNFDGAMSFSSIEICPIEIPGEKSFSMFMKEFPLVADNPGERVRFASKDFPEAAADVAVNLNLIEFFETYPTIDWNELAAISLSEGIKDQLYPSLRKAIKGKSKREAAEILLNFIQTGFPYQNDLAQFGHEKFYFADEMFHYPYSDCEDRSVLYAILIKDLTGLDVVILEYPTHAATAVLFDEEVEGASVDVDGKSYTVCDPSYIGTSIGSIMPQVKDYVPQILKI